jgi:polyphosphate kinase 2 (PPK2 family)
VLFDRSWYNRAGVEHVMGYCTQDEYEEFLRFCPQFEQALQNDGIMLVKYWLSVSDEEQERRFEKRLSDPRKRWKFSPTDLQARRAGSTTPRRRTGCSPYTDTRAEPLVCGRGRRQAHGALNLISHLLAGPLRASPTRARR